MKLLIIANAVTTQSGARGIQANKLINYLAEKNDVFLITDRAAEKSCRRELKVHSLSFAAGIPLIIKRTLRRILGPIMTFDPVYIHSSVRKAEKILIDENIDVILTLSMDLSNAVIGMKLKKRFPARILYTYISDPVSDNLYLWSGRAGKRFYMGLETRICRISDTLITPSLQTAETLKSRYGTGGCRFMNIPHCYDMIPKAAPADNNGYILHLGSLNEKRTPGPVLDEMIRSESSFRALGIKGIQLVGPVSKKLKPKLKEKYESYDWIKMTDKVSYDRVDAYITDAAILLVIDAPLDSSQFFPSKIVEYLPFGKPIIGVTPAGSETERILHKTGNLAVSYGDIARLTELIGKALSEGDRSARFNPEEFHISNVGRLWEAALKKADGSVYSG